MQLPAQDCKRTLPGTLFNNCLCCTPDFTGTTRRTPPYFPRQRKSSSLKETGRDSGQRREKTPQISLSSSFCIERHICAHVPLMMTVYTHSAKQRDKLHHWACLETDPPHWAPLEAQALKLDLWMAPTGRKTSLFIIVCLVFTHMSVGPAAQTASARKSTTFRPFNNVLLRGNKRLHLYKVSIKVAIK